MTRKDKTLLAEAYAKVIIEQIAEDWFQQGAFQTYKKPAAEPFEIAKEEVLCKL